MDEPRRLLPVKLDSYKPLREVVFESLREAIIMGRLRPGERLMELALAEELGVSRTPVREAIRKLELEGFVVMVPRKGAYVAGITDKDITDVFEVRAALEALAAGLAAERITEDEIEALQRAVVQPFDDRSPDINAVVAWDTEFHNMIYRASRNERLSQIVTNLGEQIQRFRMTTLSLPGRTKEALLEHQAIAEAISERQIELARSLAEQHIENAENSLLQAMEEEKRRSER